MICHQSFLPHWSRNGSFYYQALSCLYIQHITKPWSALVSEKQWLATMLPTLVFVFLFVTCISCSTHYRTECRQRRESTYLNVTGGQKYVMDARSFVECAADCAKYEHCLAINYCETNSLYASPVCEILYPTIPIEKCDDILDIANCIFAEKVRIVQELCMKSFQDYE